MRTLLTLLIVVGLVAMSCAAFAGTDGLGGTSGTAGVTLTVTPYCSLLLSANTLGVITVSYPATGGTSAPVNFNANANFAYDIKGTVTPPPSAPGVWSYTLDALAPNTDITNVAAGTATAKPATVSVTGITLASGQGTWPGGQLLITLAAH